MTPSPEDAAGWRPDPYQNGIERWWDGDAWTRRTRPAGDTDLSGAAADGASEAIQATSTMRPPAKAPASRAPAPRVPKWEAEATDRVKSGLRRVVKPIQELAGRDANEGDTRLLVTDILCDVLGFDKYSELSTEYRVRGDFADYAIRVGGETLAMVEVKRVTTKLSIKHLRQVEMYGVNEGVEWLILTNGGVWQVYRLIPGMPVSVDLVVEVDLLDTATTLANRATKLKLIAKEFLTRGALEDAWKVNAATAPEKLVDVLLSEGVLREARRELRRQTDHRIDDADLARLIRDTVVRPDLLK